jgi:L-lactate dehydrogenase complex protein LldG
MNTTIERLRAALATSVVSGEFPSSGIDHPGPFALEEPGADQPGLISSFRQRLEALGGAVHVVPTASAAAERVLDIAATVSTTGSFVAWDGDPFVSAAAVALERTGWRRVAQEAALPEPDRARHVHELADCALGVTGAEAALAATGSVVLRTGPGWGRLASLLPPLHVVLMDVERLAWSLRQFLRAHPDLDRSSNLVVVTGPSRTADIEMTLSRGVHGPREVHVVLIG